VEVVGSNSAVSPHYLNNLAVVEGIERLVADYRGLGRALAEHLLATGKRVSGTARVLDQVADLAKQHSDCLPSHLKTMCSLPATDRKNEDFPIEYGFLIRNIR
jgi:hypothetical protein